MNEPIIIKDNYYISKDRIVLAPPQLQIPGLAMFGKHTIKTAISPLATHYHPHCFEITFVLKGNITFSVDNIDYPLNGGDIFITFPDEPHSTNLNPISISELIWFQIDCSNPEHILFLNNATSLQLLSQMQHLTSRIFTMSSSVLHFIDEAFQNALRSAPPQLTAAFLTLLLQYLTNSSSALKTPLSHDIELSLEYISKNISNPLSLEELAEQCGLSISAYKQKFKQQTGSTPRNYINMKKIDTAKQLLDSGYRITDAAMQLGFSSSNYFSTVFKRYSFVTPTDYIQHKSSG